MAFNIFKSQKKFSGKYTSRMGFTKYYLEGELHREDGPALIFPSGDKYYYLNGVNVEKRDIDSLKIRRIAPENIIHELPEVQEVQEVREVLEVQEEPKEQEYVHVPLRFK